MRRVLALSISCVLILSACDQNAMHVDDVEQEDASTLTLRIAPPSPSLAKNGSDATNDERSTALQAYLGEVNADLEAKGMSIAVQKVEWVGGGDSNEAGQTVFAHDRQLRLSSQWVPDDPRRNADGNNITYVVDESFSVANVFGVKPVNAEPAIDASFETWDEIQCSSLNVVKLPDAGNVNYSAILDTGDDTTDELYADISTIGFLPGSLFDVVLGPGAGESVLGVTFTFIWVDENDNPTDINNDGYIDTALNEVWYNDTFVWSTDGTSGTQDIETVALHENGHALGLGHFGKVFVTENNNKLHVAPRAVMNAFILGTLREPLGTDNGAYCGLYGSWASNDS